jgi:hypothetical protein
MNRGNQEEDRGPYNREPEPPHKVPWYRNGFVHFAHARTLLVLYYAVLVLLRAQYGSAFQERLPTFRLRMLALAARQLQPTVKTTVFVHAADVVAISREMVSRLPGRRPTRCHCGLGVAAECQSSNRDLLDLSRQTRACRGANRKVGGRSLHPSS